MPNSPGTGSLRTHQISTSFPVRYSPHLDDILSSGQTHLPSSVRVGFACPDTGLRLDVRDNLSMRASVIDENDETRRQHGEG